VLEIGASLKGFAEVSGAEVKGQARSHDPAMVFSSVVAGE